MSSDGVRRYSTDVLVVGGSGAGTTAAIEISRTGLNCILVNKGRTGKSGNALMAGGGFGISGEAAKKKLGIENADESVTQEKWFSDIVKEGYFIGDQLLIEQFVEEGPNAVGEFMAWSREANQPFKFSPPGKWNSAGRCWSNTVKYAVDKYSDAIILDDVMVVDLLKSNSENRVIGALCLEIFSGDFIVIESSATIIATGGYQPFSFKNTVSDMTGDGIAAALRAGAHIADMEFLLFFPTAASPASLRGSIYPYLIQTFFGKAANVWPVYRNNLCEEIEIPEKILEATNFKKGSKLAKLVTTYYWGQQIRAGKGTPNSGIFVDYGGYTEEKYNEAINKFFKGMGSYYQPNHFQGNDISTVLEHIKTGKFLEWAPGCEYSNGGIFVNTKMETNLVGLYAAGEAASGVFGACRVGDGLVEMLVQGRVAGRSASDFVQKKMKPSSCKEASIRDRIELIEKPLHAKDGLKPRKIFTEIEAACDEGFNYIRNEKDLLLALQRLEELKNIMSIAKCSTSNRSYNYEWIRSIEAENIADCAKAGIISALGRQESRGCHIREDFPEVNHEYGIFRSVITLENNTLKLSKKQPDLSKLPAPSGKDSNVMEYFLRPDLKYNI